MKIRKALLIVESSKKAIDRSFNVLMKKNKKFSGVTLISFPDFQTLGKVISATRLELLATIRHEKPKSIQQLAKFVGRDFKNVYQDIQLLVEFGLVETRERSQGKATQPRVNFEELVLAA